jgi:hypothetical protein
MAVHYGSTIAVHYGCALWQHPPQEEEARVEHENAHGVGVARPTHRLIISHIVVPVCDRANGKCAQHISCQSITC